MVEEVCDPPLCGLDRATALRDCGEDMLLIALYGAVDPANLLGLFGVSGFRLPGICGYDDLAFSEGKLVASLGCVATYRLSVLVTLTGKASAPRFTPGGLLLFNQSSVAPAGERCGGWGTRMASRSGQRPCGQ